MSENRKKNNSIAFIGAGNMASALIDGLLADGWKADQIRASDTDQARLDLLGQKRVITSSDNSAVVSGADAIILAVKPQVIQDVLKPLKESLESSSCLLISIAAGITMDNLQSWTHPEQAIVRCMPNTPALVQLGASALFANAQCSDEQRQLANNLLKAVGVVSWLKQESDMAAVTALSGSGPAYFFLLIEAMQEAAIELGLDKKTAELLCQQTALGAARLAQSSDVDVSELRRRVTSPGGTTEAALRQFESDDFNAMVARALAKAAQRSRELAEPASDTE
ncbi:MAG: pyrroline-5-carboxylate reductase [Gammaproteobacteria bacterium]